MWSPADIPAGNVPDRSSHDPRLGLINDICTGELLGAFGLSGGNTGIAGSAGRRVTLRIARQILEYDRLVGEGGLGYGGSWALERMVGKAHFSGVENIPEEGPLMVVSNHPGLSDTVALFSAIPRDDLMVIAARRGLLDALPHTSRRLFVLDADDASGSRVVRAASRHMRSGGSLLTFPGGKIEPDPASMEGASDALGRWSGSVDLFARLVPGLAVIPVIVSGVVSAAAMRNPLAYLRRSEEDRRWLAATLQMMFPAMHRVEVEVAFGHPVVGGARVSEEVIRRAGCLVSRRRAASSVGHP